MQRSTDAKPHLIRTHSTVLKIDPISLLTPADCIRHERQIYNLTIIELATKIGVSSNALSYIERRHTHPSFSTIKSLSRLFDKPIHYFGCFEMLPEETLGDRIIKARHYLGLNIGELADMIGVGHKSIYNWENGRSNPDPKYNAVLEKILLILK